jgi:glucosamine 6-phosphate synthetase-like amidotransferase/phosphosugar isomerase protein
VSSKKLFRGRILNIMNIIAVIKERFTDLTYFVDAFIEKSVKTRKTFAIMINIFYLLRMKSGPLCRVAGE